MATLGHSLVGLALAGCSRAESRKNALRYIWPGLMILLSHLVDLVELAGTWLSSDAIDAHFLTHSWWRATVLVVAVLAMLRLLSRLRTPWPYMLAAAAILSHLPLDSIEGRNALAYLYGFKGNEPPSLYLLKTIAAEAWIYGLLLVLVLLVRAARRDGSPASGRKFCIVFGLAAVLAAATRIVPVWLTVYLMAAIHAGILLRRDLRLGMLWSLAPVVPLLVYFGSEVYRSSLERRAEDLRLAGEFAEALPYLKRAANFCTRDSKMWLYIHMGECHFELNDLMAAELNYRRAADNPPFPNLGQYWLAWFYANTRLEGTPFYRPVEAANILRQILATEARGEIRDFSEQLLRRIPPSAPAASSSASSPTTRGEP